MESVIETREEVQDFLSIQNYNYNCGYCKSRVGGIVMTKDKLISAMSRFCPSIIGECLKCGEPIFEGYLCIGCGFDASYKEVKDIKLED